MPQTPQVETFEASLAQLDRGDVDQMPKGVREVFGDTTNHGWVARATAGSVKRVHFWWSNAALVSCAETNDLNRVGLAALSCGPARLVHLADLWFPPPSAVPGEWPSGLSLGELVDAARSGELGIGVGVLGRADEPRRSVVVRSGGELLRGVVSGAEEHVKLRRAGLAGLWSEIVTTVST